MTIAALLAPDRLASLDADRIRSFNVRAKDEYRLQPELGASAYEGDIDRARVVLLLANPSFDETSTHGDHSFARDGWPLAGLYPEAPPGLHNWWHARLRHLINNFGAEYVSKTVACLQATPWASRNFDDGLRLPSRIAVLDAATQCAARGAVLIVMRAERLWLESPGVTASSRRFRVNSWRSSYVSPGNLPELAWTTILEVMRPV